MRVKPATDLAAIAVYKNKGNFRENRNGVILSLLMVMMKWHVRGAKGWVGPVKTA